jgi:hypothetical protein
MNIILKIIHSIFETYNAVKFFYKDNYNTDTHTWRLVTYEVMFLLYRFLVIDYSQLVNV